MTTVFHGLKSDLSSRNSCSWNAIPPSEHATCHTTKLYCLFHCRFVGKTEIKLLNLNTLSLLSLIEHFIATSNTQKLYMFHEIWSRYLVTTDQNVWLLTTNCKLPHLCPGKTNNCFSKLGDTSQRPKRS